MTEKSTEPTAAEKLAATLAGGEPAEGTTEPAEKPADATEDPAEGEDTGQEKPEEADAAAEKLTKPDGTPFTATDLAALNTALKAARKEARDALGEVATLKTKTGDRTVEQIESEAATAAEMTWKPRLVSSSARAELRAAGLALPEGREAEAMARAVRLLDVDALDIGDDGSVTGLAEQIDALRVDFPSLFQGAPVARPGVPRVQAADRRATNQPKTAAELIAASLLG